MTWNANEIKYKRNELELYIKENHMHVAAIQ